ncbi:hypothetical protein [Chelatococcus reniformis]|uniref:Uncharacterized protein n=1 Tax=Chelatococcus reniformis TaxID=1494448 RepID=A0A916TZC2_9HYPH|nr:hypothetical protein [Chelatococcus reniformis]GGC52564.1 hypothetical protein GCM10010994_09540 [Chelatococcus reniformis]
MKPVEHRSRAFAASLLRSFSTRLTALSLTIGNRPIERNGWRVVSYGSFERAVRLEAGAVPGAAATGDLALARGTTQPFQVAPPIPAASVPKPRPPHDGEVLRQAPIKTNWIYVIIGMRWGARIRTWE